MRDLKFRAWHKEYKKMVFFDLTGKNIVCGDVYDGFGLCDDEFHRGYEYLDDKFELMQFIGIQDKNGKDIYEGDVVEQTIEASDFNVRNFRIYRSEKHKAVIYFDEDSAIFTTRFDLGKKLHPFYECLRICDSDAVVIGTIYENPDLLK